MSETIYRTNSTLPSVYEDFSDQEFEEELDRTLSLTALDLKWMEELGANPFETDADILETAELGKLARVSSGLGYMVIGRLQNWDYLRSNPDHKFYYSPPFLTHKSFETLESVAKSWQAEMGQSRFLAITSLIRSQEYQTNLATQKNKLTGVKSSHTVGWSFDIDGCGLYEQQDSGVVKAINPRFEGYRGKLAIESRLVIKSVLSDLAYNRDDINVVEELAGTQEHCFHVCVRP